MIVEGSCWMMVLLENGVGGKGLGYGAYRNIRV